MTSQTKSRPSRPRETELAAYVRDNRAAGLNSAVMAEYDARIRAADAAANAARRASAERLNALSPEAWAAERSKFIAEQDTAQWARWQQHAPRPAARREEPFSDEQRFRGNRSGQSWIGGMKP